MAAFTTKPTNTRASWRKNTVTFLCTLRRSQIIAGQGTLGLEILEQIPDLDSIVISIGGGGLISGVATAIKALRPQVKIFGVVTNVAPE